MKLYHKDTLYSRLPEKTPSVGCIYSISLHTFSPLVHLPIFFVPIACLSALRCYCLVSENCPDLLDFNHAESFAMWGHLLAFCILTPFSPFPSSSWCLGWEGVVSSLLPLTNRIASRFQPNEGRAAESTAGAVTPHMGQAVFEICWVLPACHSSMRDYLDWREKEVELHKLYQLFFLNEMEPKLTEARNNMIGCSFLVNLRN